MLHASSNALRAHVEAALGGRCAVTAEPPPTSLDTSPEPDGRPRGIGIHLFHIAAADQGRAVDAVEVRDGSCRVVGRRPPVRRYRTRWLVWSWAPTAPERLELLDGVLALLAAEPVLPEGAAGPELAAGGPLQLETAPAAGTAAELAGVFAGLGVPARPALELVLTAGLVPPVEPVSGPPSDVRLVSRPHRRSPGEEGPEGFPVGRQIGPRR
ncbi:Pvc16 family protein [Streptomyces sp. NPDC001594]|uniref:Pvc16 family protein n=1 Tax=Streptomyces sp. NPDC001594 TaxID=3364590 RepID=UPI0036B7FFBC